MADGGHLEFQDFVTFFHLDVSSNLKLDIFRHTWQPLEFWFRGGAWEPPFSTKLMVSVAGFHCNLRFSKSCKKFHIEMEKFLLLETLV